MDRDAADHRRDRPVESGVQPGPIRTDSEVKAGVVGLGDEKASERRNNETEKAKIRGDQRKSGCQKNKTRRGKPPVLRNDFSGFNYRLIEVPFSRWESTTMLPQHSLCPYSRVALAS